MKKRFVSSIPIIILLLCLNSGCLNSSSGSNSQSSQNNSAKFSVVSHRIEKTGREYTYLFLEVKNTGSIPAGVELHIEARDKNGTIVDQADLWPASTNNIQPNEVYAYKYPLHDYGKTEKVKIRILRTQKW